MSMLENERRKPIIETESYEKSPVHQPRTSSRNWKKRTCIKYETKRHIDFDEINVIGGFYMVQEIAIAL